MNQVQEVETMFINAAGAVYCWMCAADGVVSESESEGFTKYLNTLTFVNDLSHKTFTESYADLTKIFENDFEKGYKHALSVIKPLKDSKVAAASLIRVAREALVADGKLEEVEENVLKELCTLLDVNEADIL